MHAGPGNGWSDGAECEPCAAPKGRADTSGAHLLFLLWIDWGALRPYFKFMRACVQGGQTTWAAMQTRTPPHAACPSSPTMRPSRAPNGVAGWRQATSPWTRASALRWRAAIACLGLWRVGNAGWATTLHGRRRWGRQVTARTPVWATSLRSVEGRPRCRCTPYEVRVACCPARLKACTFVSPFLCWCTHRHRPARDFNLHVVSSATCKSVLPLMLRARLAFWCLQALRSCPHVRPHRPSHLCPVRLSRWNPHASVRRACVFLAAPADQR